MIFSTFKQERHCLCRHFSLHSTRREFQTNQKQIMISSKFQKSICNCGWLCKTQTRPSWVFKNQSLLCLMKSADLLVKKNSRSMWGAERSKTCKNKEIGLQLQQFLHTVILEQSTHFASELCYLSFTHNMIHR